MRLLYLPILLAFLPYPAFGQTLDRNAQQAAFQLQIARVTDEIKVDGDLSESTWKTAAVAGDFWLKWPRDGARRDECHRSCVARRGTEFV